MTPIPRSLFSWIAILSLVLGGILPRIGNAAKVNTSAMQICSSTASGKTDAPTKSGSRHSHCANCNIGSDTPLALPVVSHEAIDTKPTCNARHDVETPARLVRPFPDAQPRAPPADRSAA